jgi:hypothetical protein
MKNKSGRRSFLKTNWRNRNRGCVIPGGVLKAGAEEAPAKNKTADISPRRKYNGEYKNEFLNRVAFPMGGIGAGMICMEGTGALSHVSIKNKPDILMSRPYLLLLL